MLLPGSRLSSLRAQGMVGRHSDRCLQVPQIAVAGFSTITLQSLPGQPGWRRSIDARDGVPAL
jgi:hypothetical protein